MTPADDTVTVGEGLTISVWGGTLTEIPDAYQTYGVQVAWQLTRSQDTAYFKITTADSADGVRCTWDSDQHTVISYNKGISYSNGDPHERLNIRHSHTDDGAMSVNEYLIKLTMTAESA